MLSYAEAHIVLISWNLVLFQSSWLQVTSQQQRICWKRLPTECGGSWKILTGWSLTEHSLSCGAEILGKKSLKHISKDFIICTSWDVAMTAIHQEFSNIIHMLHRSPFSSHSPPACSGAYQHEGDECGASAVIRQEKAGICLFFLTSIQCPVIFVHCQCCVAHLAVCAQCAKCSVCFWNQGTG